MRVFIDEAGTFQIPSVASKVSVIAAVAIPESMVVGLFRRFRRATRSWRQKGEIKGSKLDEAQVAEILKVLRRDDIVVIATGIDLGLHTADGLAAHQRQQARKFERAARRAPESFRQYYQESAERLRALSPQLYVQAVVLTDVIRRILNEAFLYYRERVPSTIRELSICIDAKDVKVTSGERSWLSTVGPLLEVLSSQDPMLVPDDGQAPPLAPHSTTDDPLRHGLSVERAILDHVSFRRSHLCTGLQVADVVATTIRRACNGTLGRGGWDRIGALTLQRAGEHQSLAMLALQDPPRAQARQPWMDVQEQIQRSRKRILVRR